MKEGLKEGRIGGIMHHEGVSGTANKEIWEMKSTNVWCDAKQSNFSTYIKHPFSNLIVFEEDSLIITPTL